MKLSDFSTLTFDCYGTLIDWESGIVDSFTSLMPATVETPDRDELLVEYSSIEKVLQADRPGMKYSELVSETLLKMVGNLGVEITEAMRAQSMNVVGTWPAFADSVASLQYLKKHYKLVVLSNVDNRSFAESNKKLDVVFDAIYTAEDIGSYKPSLKNFHYMLEKLQAMGISQNEILHTAQSLHHDMVPATEIGLVRCWIDRRSEQQGPGATPVVNQEITTEFRFVSLQAMVQAHSEEVQS